jgi:hypothetical protein
MTITEPVTMVTDYILAVVCIVFGVVTIRLDRVHRAMALWALTFFAAAVSGILGGTHHGFKLNIPKSTDNVLWDTALLAIGATGAFMLCAAIVSSLRNKQELYVRWIIAGLSLSIAAFVVQKVGWDLHQHLNHNDLHHVVQIAGFCCLFKGAMTLASKHQRKIGTFTN